MISASCTETWGKSWKVNRKSRLHLYMYKYKCRQISKFNYLNDSFRIILSSEKIYCNSSGNCPRRQIHKFYQRTQENFIFLSKNKLLLQLLLLRISKVYNIWYWDFCHGFILKYKGFVYYLLGHPNFKEKWKFYNILLFLKMCSLEH